MNEPLPFDWRLAAIIFVIALSVMYVVPKSAERAAPSAYIGHFNGAPCKDKLPMDGSPLECRWVFPNGEWVYTRSY